MGSPVGDVVEMEGCVVAGPRQRASCAPPTGSRPEPAAGWRPVQCRGRQHQRASCAPPPGSRSRLPVGGPCSVEVVRVRHHPAADRSRLPAGGPRSVEVVDASEFPYHSEVG
jgi:hypothetical protein